MRYKVVVSYDGSFYFGFQTQPNHRTVQSEIEKTLLHVYHQPIKIVASGRTDALVHAKGQTFHYDSKVIIKVEKLKNVINKHLLNDIRIVSIEEVDDSFHARYDVLKKEYRYFISLGDYDVFRQHYVTFFNKKLDMEAIHKASQYFLGEHDFRSFTKNKNLKNTVRTIETFDITKQGNEITIRVVGNGFLHNMVRIIVGALLRVGTNKLSPEDIKSILDEKNRVYAPFIAPPQGLVLWNVAYKKDI